MFQFRSETLEIEGRVFVVTEPSTQTLEKLASSDPRPSLIGMCVTVDGNPLGDVPVPWRIGSKLQEAFNRVSSSSGNEVA